VTLDYRLPLETNTGLAAVSPAGSQFLPLSFWYPQYNTQFSIRGADVAPFRLSVTLPAGMQVVSSGKVAGSAVDQALNGLPFFLVGNWDLVEGAGEARGITTYLPKGATPGERKAAEDLIAFAQAARGLFTTMLGPAPDTAIRLVSVYRGAGFADAGTVLLDPAVFRRGQIDSNTAVLIGEAVAKVWLGAATPIRGEGAGALSEGLSQYLATLAIEKQFGKESAAAERTKERLAYAAVARRDAPLALATPADDSYFSSVANKGALVWRLIDQLMGRDAFVSVLKTQLQAASGSDSGLRLASLRAALAEKGGPSLKSVMDLGFDRPTEMDLQIGIPQQKGAQWSAALRNTGTVNVKVPITAITDSGQRLNTEAEIAAQSFSEALFNTPARLVRVEIDPDKLYPQLDYANDVAPRSGSPEELLVQANSAFAKQDFNGAEASLRKLLSVSSASQEAHVLLGRTLLGANKLDDAEKEFSTALKDSLPSASTLGWANVGLGEIALRRGQAAEAVRRFSFAAAVDAEYGSTLAARQGRIKAEAAANTAAAPDAAVQSFVGQLDAAIKSGHKNDLESLIVPGELTTFVKGIVGSQPEAWQTRVLRTEQVDANKMLADVSINARQLGRDVAGPAVLVLLRQGNGWKLSSIEYFEVR
jgi:tetratricopeptide (TPR) repeat protein